MMFKIVLSFLATVLSIFAFISTLAVRRSPDLKEPPIVNIGRNILVGGWFLMAARCLYVTLAEGYFLYAPNVGLLALILVALGTTIVSFGRLLAVNLKSQCDDCPWKVSEQNPL